MYFEDNSNLKATKTNADVLTKVHVNEDLISNFSAIRAPVMEVWDSDPSSTYSIHFRVKKQTINDGAVFVVQTFFSRSSRSNHVEVA